jgi:hypothetical protein
MNRGYCDNATFLVAASLVLRCCAGCFADDAEPTQQLGLTDLVKYRAALMGKATADDASPADPPVYVSFRDLWNRPDVFRGRHVTTDGRVQRIFRQGPIGSFPALAEIWIVSPAGDVFCLVAPHRSSTSELPEHGHSQEDHATPQRIPKPGQTVRFTGTFLKMIRYRARDGDRLAPLIVGDQPPALVREIAKANRASSFADNIVGQQVGSAASWLLLLILALLTAGMLAWKHLHTPMRRSVVIDPGRGIDRADLNPALEFIEPHDNP